VKNLTPVLILLLLGLAFSGTQIGGCTPPPIHVSVPTVLLVEETANRSTYTQDQLNAITATDGGSVKAAVEAIGGQFQAVDVETKVGLPWVLDGLKVPRQGLPWVIGADSASGFSVPLTTEADLKQRAAGLH